MPIITKEQGRACLDMMREIAHDGPRVQPVDAFKAYTAMNAIGWTKTAAERFDHGRQFRHQVMVALAFCAAISECNIALHGQEGKP